MFKLTYERLDKNTVVLHCTVERWSVQVARELDIAVAVLFDYLHKKGFTKAITASPNPKFCEYMGGTRETTLVSEGREYGVYTWDLTL